MIPKLKINKNVINKGWKTKAERMKIREFLGGFTDFKAFDAYRKSAEMFAFCFEGHEGICGNLKMVKYGYALDPESIEKFVCNNFADDENEYLVCIGSMSMDYEKYYKNGTFIYTDGMDTGMDFYQLQNAHELEKKAYLGNKWITFIVYDLNRSPDGILFPKGLQDWMKDENKEE